MAEFKILTGKLIYFGDPMCSWCWGIANSLSELKNKFKDSLSFELVMGGLRPGGGDPWNDEMKAFLKEHWGHVNDASGQEFNYGIFNKSHFNYDTEPPSRAVVLVRSMFPNLEFDFFKSIQHRFYVKNEDPGEESFYEPLCDKYSIPFDDFMAKFTSVEFVEKTNQDFMKSRQYGIRGFPSVVFQSERATEMVTNGFATYDQMRTRVLALLRK